MKARQRLMGGHAQASRLKVARGAFVDSRPWIEKERRSGYGRRWRFDR
jgi:hypothetical protein